MVHFYHCTFSINVLCSNFLSKEEFGADLPLQHYVLIWKISSSIFAYLSFSISIDNWSISAEGMRSQLTSASIVVISGSMRRSGVNCSSGVMWRSEFIWRSLGVIWRSEFIWISDKSALRPPTLYDIGLDDWYKPCVNRRNRIFPISYYDTNES